MLIPKIVIYKIIQKYFIYNIDIIQLTALPYDIVIHTYWSYINTQNVIVVR